MTENEAIKELKEDLIELGKAIPCDTGWGNAINEAYSMAIQALEEIQQYRAIGTVEEFKALKEKEERFDRNIKMFNEIGLEIRAKAIDEFKDDIKAELIRIATVNYVDVLVLYEIMDRKAEQLKAGGIDG